VKETTTSQDSGAEVNDETSHDATGLDGTTEQSVSEHSDAGEEQPDSERNSATGGPVKRKLGRRARRAAAQKEAADEDGATDAAEGAGGTAVIDEPGDVDEAVDVDEAGDPTGSKVSTTKTSKAGAAKAGATKTAKPRAKARKARVPRTKVARTKAAKPEGRSGGALGSAQRLSRVIIALLVIAVLLAVTLLVQLIKGPGDGSNSEQREDRREAARQSAELATARLFSFDYRKLDEDLAAQRAQTTGDFTREVETLTGPNLRPVAAKVQAVVQAVALNSAVVEDGDGKGDVQVLVFLNQAVTSNLLPAPRLDRNRVVASMREVNGQWKVAGIRAL